MNYYIVVQRFDRLDAKCKKPIVGLVKIQSDSDNMDVLRSLAIEIAIEEDKRLKPNCTFVSYEAANGCVPFRFQVHEAKA